MQRLRWVIVVATISILGGWLITGPDAVPGANTSAFAAAPQRGVSAEPLGSGRAEGPRDAITVRLLTPSVTEVVRPGFPFSIDWEVSDPKAKVTQRTLKLSTNSGATFSADIKGTGKKKKPTFSWNVPKDLLTKTARIQLTLTFSDGTTSVVATGGDFFVSPLPLVNSVLFTEAEGKKPARLDIAGEDFRKNDAQILLNSTPFAGVEYLGKVSKIGTVKRLRVEGANLVNLLIPGIRVTISVKLSSTGVSSAETIFRRAAELVQSISPSSTRQGSVVDAVISGSKFTGATSVTFAVPGTTAEILSGATDTGLPVRLTITSDAAVGILNFQIHVPLGIIDSEPVRFTVLPASAPSISSVSPEFGSASGGTPVLVRGNDFVPRDTEVLFGSRSAVSVEVLDARSLVAIAPAGEAGGADITVVTRSGYGSAENAFRYDAEDEQAPEIAEISPSSVRTIGGEPVTITGSGFLPGATRVSFGETDALDVRVLDSTHLVAVAPAASAGAVSVSVQTQAGSARQLAAVVFEFDSPAAPELSGLHIAPLRIQDSGDMRPLHSADISPAGGRIVLRGSGFVPGFTQVFVGSVPAEIESLRENLLVISAPAGLRGIADITVSTPGGIAVLDRAVRFESGDLALTSIDRIVHPARNPDGSMDVLVLGTGFIPGQTFVAFDHAFQHPVKIEVVSHNSLRITVPAGEKKPGRLLIWTLAGQSSGEIPEQQ